jgi:hypothetical protein
MFNLLFDELIYAKKTIRSIFPIIPEFGKIAPELELLKVPDSRGQVE